jgi:hypothetical protein
MKKSSLFVATSTIITASVIIFSAACSSGTEEAKPADKPIAATEQPKEKKETNADVKKGIGEITHVELTHPLNPDMISRGKGVFEMKCSACHKLSAEKLVGPGWEGISTRRTPEWIMNMITNTDVMLDKDPEAQKLLETCMVRMPNQGLSMGDCRDILEFMRKNDNQK